MGRKSSAKKKRRAEKKTENIKEKKKGFFKKLKTSKSKKTKKKEPKKTTKKKQRKLKISKKQIFAGTLTLIMLTILVAVGYLLFQKAFKPRPIAKLLPADNTIAIVEINSNFDHHQLTKTFRLLEDHENYSKEKLIQLIETSFLINYETEIEPWLGRVVGFAVIASPEQENKINIVYFAEVFSQANAKEFIKKSASETNYEGNKIYIASSGKSKTIIDEYLFIGNNSEIIKELIDFNKSSNPTLYSSESYRRIDDNMPLNKAAFFYINADQINDEFFQAFPALSEKGLSVETAQPLLDLFKAEGLSLVALDDKFAIQSFLSLDRESLEDSEYLSFREKYSADLLQYIESQAIAFWGGENLEYQIKRLLEALGGGEGAITIFDKFLQNSSQKYLGPEINFKNDILPLFANEFALAIEKHNNKNIYKLIIELDDPSADAVKIHEIADNFAEIGAVFEPQVVEHILEDGTITKEIVAVPEEITETETTYKGSTIYEMKMGEQNWAVAYTTIGNVGIISTNIAGIRNAIDAKEGDIESLKSSETYKTLIQPILEHSDEVTYFNMEELLPIMFGKQLPPFLEIVSSISSGKNYFNDGITSINYLRIK